LRDRAPSSAACASSAASRDRDALATRTAPTWRRTAAATASFRKLAALVAARCRPSSAAACSANRRVTISSAWLAASRSTRWTAIACWMPRAARKPCGSAAAANIDAAALGPPFAS
jgi:hypothetical protein